MEITDYQVFSVPPRWVFLRLETDTGLVGWGEATLAGHSKATVAAVETVMDHYLLGKDPMEIERHWQAMYRGQYFRDGPILMSAIGGIDTALWDLKGKHFGAPVYELLGGRARDHIDVYQWIGGESASAVSDAAADAVENGYDVLKMEAVAHTERLDSPETIERARERVAAVREEVGERIDLVVDFSGRVTTGAAKRLAAALDEYDPMFYEEPVRPAHFEALPKIEAHATTPLGTGERLYSRWAFQDIIEDRLVDVIQPDPSSAGGISEVKKIANAAETADISVSLHSPFGPIAFAACLQLDMVVPNALAQGQDLEIHDPEDNDLLRYLRDPTAFGFEDGHVRAPDGPGLGITVNEEYVRQQAQLDVDWQNPIWYHDDGSIAEW
ncbi:galactonate dehydratase [Halapricum hydrolyticum]|uniref:Galactonate dehydratase n=1 Tax=Halapricum hydrolyticum TaxID=2979991 RepID=A0AAE3IBG9_9EURY|nr:galactonate dehydratase [Halapricum hydrolyticum]MCU4718520.1 galactonate dehydratase [Halapricum hydrolyticum]MCU4727461.1 galactonate dehydratase [Halapricum hydrolyticum]